MEIIQTKKEHSLTLMLIGRLETTTAASFEEVIEHSLSDVTELILDFEKVEYVSSAGLRVLLSAQKTMNRKGTMKLLHVPDNVREVLEITGFDRILTIC